MQARLTKKYWLLYIILGFSVALNVLVIVIDTIPFFWPKIEHKLSKKEFTINDPAKFETVIANRALEMAKAKNVTMVWKDHRGPSEVFFDFARQGNNTEFKKFNYPRAFLYYGLTEYFTKAKDDKSLNEVKAVFDHLIDNQGNPQFPLDKVDQVPLGLASINLYKKYKEQKYLSFCHLLYETVTKNIETSEENIVLYRKGSDNQLNDMIGMIVPFLVEYHQLTLKEDALKIAKDQVNFFIKYGIDKDTYIPAHGIALKSKIKTGSCNWGRGIGWYLLGLTYLHSQTGLYSNEYTGISQTLTKVKNKDGVWSQFPGSTELFDASATTMFMYSFSKKDGSLYTKNQVLKLLESYFQENGTIGHTSGDTYGLNSYSKTFGDSELSQGMLLLLLSNLK